MSGPQGCGAVTVVDDDPRLCILVQELLEEAGYAVRTIDSGVDAVRAIVDDLPSLVILDVNLPGLSGYEVCRSLRQRVGQSLPILFLSGDRIEPHDRVAGLLLGGDDYLVKPFASDELLARVHALIRRSSGPAANGGPRLTRRELEILELLAEGLQQAGIAERLVISPKTVATHIERILAKLGVHSRAEAVAVAYRERIISLPA